MEGRGRNQRAVWLVVAAVLLWSTGGLFIKLASLDAFQITFFRSFLAAVTVIALTRRKGLRIDGFTAICSAIYAALLLLFVWATKQTTAANAIFLQYTAPIYILILAPFLIGEKFQLRDLATVAFCIIGMSLFFVGDLSAENVRGNLAALASGVFLGLYILLLKNPRYSLAEGGMPSQGEAELESSTCKSAEAIDLKEAEASRQENARSDEGVGFAYSYASVGLEDSGKSAGGRASAFNPAITVIYGNLILAAVTLPSGFAAFETIRPLDIAAVLWLGIFQIGIAYVLFIRGVHDGVRPLDASIIGFIEPLLNPLWVFLFTSEKPSRWALLGGAIILATVALHTVAQYRLGEVAKE
jgi:drug/metabolite transporter (DMT)-like permease